MNPNPIDNHFHQQARVSADVNAVFWRRMVAAAAADQPSGLDPSIERAVLQARGTTPEDWHHAVSTFAAWSNLHGRSDPVAAQAAFAAAAAVQQERQAERDRAAAELASTDQALKDANSALYAAQSNVEQAAQLRRHAEAFARELAQLGHPDFAGVPGQIAARARATEARADAAQRESLALDEANRAAEHQAGLAAMKAVTPSGSWVDSPDNSIAVAREPDAAGEAAINADTPVEVTNP